MKKWLLLLFVFSSFSLQALPLGNPAEPGMFCRGIFFNTDGNESCTLFHRFLGLRAGYYGDFVYNRKLKIDGVGSGFDHGIKSTRIITNAGYLALNICNRGDIFATLGNTKLTLSTNTGAWFGAPFPGQINGNVVLETTDSFSWSVGARLLLLNWNCWKIGFEGQYFSATPELKTFVDQVFAGNIFHLEAPVHFFEWQLGTGLSYKYDICCAHLSLIPYVGVKWAKCKFMTHNFPLLQPRGPDSPLFIYNTKSRSHWGFPIGLSLVFKESVELNVETRWGDERALSLKGQFQF